MNLMAFDQGDNPAGCLRGAPVVMGALPETPGPAFDAGSFAAQVGEVDLVDQRPVTENPVVFIAHRSAPTAMGDRLCLPLLPRVELSQAGALVKFAVLLEVARKQERGMPSGILVITVAVGCAPGKQIKLVSHPIIVAAKLGFFHG